MDHLEAHLVDQLDIGEGFFWHRGRWDAVRGQIGPRGAISVLDVGAGSGFAGAALSRDYPDASYFFWETMPAMERHLEARFGAGRNLRDRDISSIDVVLLLDVLEHQEDDAAFLAGWLSRMKPGSELIGTVPAFDLLWSEWDRLLGHHRRYRAGDIRRLASALPAELVSVSYLFPEMVVPGLARKAVTAIRRRPASASGDGAEFPHLPQWLNSVVYGLHRCVAPFQPVIPFGTSVIFRLRRR